MNYNASEQHSITFLETLIGVTLREVSDEITFSAVRSLFSVVLKGGLCLALGPFSFILPMADLATLVTKIGLKTYGSLERQRIMSTHYRIETTESESLIAEKLVSGNSDVFPFELPDYHKMGLNALRSSNQYAENLHLLRTNKPQGSDIYPDLIREFSYTCAECSEIVTYTHGVWAGHKSQCSFAPTLLRSQPNKCKECGRILVMVRGILVGHEANCSLKPDNANDSLDQISASYSICSRCGQKLVLLGGWWRGHKDDCPANPRSW